MHSEQNVCPKQKKVQSIIKERGKEGANRMRSSQVEEEVRSRDGTRSRRSALGRPESPPFDSILKYFETLSDYSQSLGGLKEGGRPGAALFSRCMFEQLRFFLSSPSSRPLDHPMLLIHLR
jgi:hypothetical protein